VTTPKPKYTPAPRPWNEAQVAARLNRGVEWFRRSKALLEAQGFPQKDDLLNGWDSKAIEMWMDRRSRIELPANDAEGELLGAIHARAH
jgi:hypothetical protein